MIIQSRFCTIECVDAVDIDGAVNGTVDATGTGTGVGDVAILVGVDLAFDIVYAVDILGASIGVVATYSTSEVTTKVAETSTGIGEDVAKAAGVREFACAVACTGEEVSKVEDADVGVVEDIVAVEVEDAGMRKGTVEDASEDAGAVAGVGKDAVEVTDPVANDVEGLIDAVDDKGYRANETVDFAGDFAGICEVTGKGEVKE